MATGKLRNAFGRCDHENATTNSATEPCLQADASADTEVHTPHTTARQDVSLGPLGPTLRDQPERATWRHLTDAVASAARRAYPAFLILTLLSTALAATFAGWRSGCHTVSSESQSNVSKESGFGRVTSATPYSAYIERL